MATWIELRYLKGSDFLFLITRDINTIIIQCFRIGMFLHLKFPLISWHYQEPIFPVTCHRQTILIDWLIDWLLKCTTKLLLKCLTTVASESLYNSKAAHKILKPLFLYWFWSSASTLNMTTYYYVNMYFAIFGTGCYVVSYLDNVVQKCFAITFEVCI